VRVFVDHAVEDGFSADPRDVEAGHGGQGSVAPGVGDALGDALVRPGGVVVNLVLDQDRAQVRLAKDQHAVEEFTAQGSDEAFADRVHIRIHAVDRGLASAVQKRLDVSGELGVVLEQEPMRRGRLCPCRRLSDISTGAPLATVSR
jgi:hypothetical protein